MSQCVITGAFSYTVSPLWITSGSLAGIFKQVTDNTLD